MLQRFAVGSCLGLVVMLGAACGSSAPRTGFDTDATEPGTNGDGTAANPGSIGQGQAPDDPKADECQKMDIVFVVDDSGSMAEEQANLASNFPDFVATLNSFTSKSGSKLDWRAAVTTTGRDVSYTITPPFGLPPIPQSEKGDNGAFRTKSACGSLRPWVERNDPNAESTFSCLAEVGTGGPSLEMPLQTLKLALNDRMADGKNAGFLRDDALLAVVILTDEDDCSREDNDFTMTAETDSCYSDPQVRPVGTYMNMLDSVAHGAGRWATAVIAGATTCKSSFGDASEAKRLEDFVSLAGKNGRFSSICAGNLTTALKEALDTFDGACRTFPPVK